MNKIADFTKVGDVHSTHASHIVQIDDMTPVVRRRAYNLGLEKASNRDVSWDTLNQSYRLFRAFGADVLLSFGEGDRSEEKAREYDREKQSEEHRRAEALKTHDPVIVLSSDELHSGLALRRESGNLQVIIEASESVARSIRAMEKMRLETDRILVDAFLAGGNRAVAVRYDTLSGDGTVTWFFHRRPITETEDSFMAYVVSTMEAWIQELDEDGMDVSSLRKVVSKLADAS